MSDAKNLNDFFAQNSKKKKTKKPAPKAAQPAAAAAAEETTEAQSPAKTTAAAASTAAQPEPQPAQPAQDYQDSSDDEGNLEVVNQKIIERKDLEAKKAKKEETGDLSAGWGLGSKLGQAAAQQEESTSVAAPAKGPPTFTGGKMNFGKPMFNRK